MTRKILLTLQAICSLLFVIALRQLDLLTNTILLYLSLILIALWILDFFLLQNRHTFVKVLAVLLSAAVSILTILPGYALWHMQQALETVTDTETTQTETVILYAKDTMTAAKVKMTGILANTSATAKEAILDQMQEDGIQTDVETFTDSPAMFQALEDGDIQAMILNAGWLGLFEEDQIPDSLQILTLAEYEVHVDTSAQKTDITTKPFNVYISGGDYSGELNESSRSDVNLIASIDPASRQILLVSIPRDLYVETICTEDMGCAYGQMDKLTHTTLDGVKTAEMTLENLLGIEINYNVQVNYSSLKDIVNALGGIDVDNPHEFTAGKYDFKPGIIHMDGAMALRYARERKSFTEGDRERGKNQIRVLEAIIEKATDPGILTRYAQILTAVSSSLSTNMSLKEIGQLVKMQLSEGGDWTFYTYSIDGTNAREYCAKLGSTAYVMLPDSQTVANAKADIEAIDRGEIPPHINSTDEEKADA